MSKKIKIDQFLDIDRLDNVRKELTLKFDKFDEKIDSKLSAKLFFTLIGLFTIILGGTFTYSFSLINDLTNKTSELNKNVAVEEIKIDNLKY